MNEPFPPILTKPSRTGAVRLLESAGLPASDLTDAYMDHFFYSGSANSPEAIVGVQLCGADALLRSLVVNRDLRAQGLGSRLFAHAETYARDRGARVIYLLTTTAEAFFRSRGYVAMPRESAPPAIRATTEFAALCPATSAFLSKRL
jgi:amino-acid N-acetyltransferase